MTRWNDDTDHHKTPVEVALQTLNALYELGELKTMESLSRRLTRLIQDEQREDTYADLFERPVSS